MHTQLEPVEKSTANLLENTQEWAVSKLDNTLKLNFSNLSTNCSFHTANDASMAYESMLDGEYKTMDLIEEDINENIPPSESYIDINSLKTDSQIPASSSSVFPQNEEQVQKEPEEPTVVAQTESVEEPKSSFTLKISKKQEEEFIEEPDVLDTDRESHEKESIPSSDHEPEEVAHDEKLGVDMSSPIAEIKSENENIVQITNEILNKQLFVESPEVGQQEFFKGDFSTESPYNNERKISFTPDFSKMKAYKQWRTRNCYLFKFSVFQKKKHKSY